VKIHPIVARLVDAEILEKMKAHAVEAEPRQRRDDVRAAGEYVIERSA
jgi:hypothetical protein